MKPWVRLTALLLCVALLFVSTGCRSEATTADKTIRVILDALPVSLDPQLAEDDETLLLVRNAFEGLFRIDGGNVVNAACESYTLSDDKQTVTFTLRKGLTWSDGTALTAEDFRFGLVRALRPETEAPNAERLFSIRNAVAVHEGLADESTLGIRVQDDRTLVLQLIQPDPDLTETLTYAMTMPCRESLFEEAAGRYGMSADLTLCNGPFTVSYWDESSLKLKRNDAYVGPFTAKPAAVSVRAGNTDTERIQSVSTDLADLAAIGFQSEDAAKDAALTTKTFFDTTWLLCINSAAKTIGDATVAHALTEAIGADVLEGNLPARFVQANGFVADDLLIGTQPLRTVNGVTHVTHSQTESAKSDLLEALKSYGGSMSALTLLYANIDGMKHTAGVLAQHWQKELGVVVNIEGLSSDELCAAVEAGTYTMALYPLSADDGKAETQLRRFASITGRSTEAIDQAMAETSLKKQAQALTKIETEWLSDVYTVPLAQSGRCFAMSTSLTDVNIDLCQGMIALYSVGRF